MAFLLCQLLIGCSGNSNTTALHYLNILEKVQKNPSKASLFCAEVTDLDKREECLLSAVELLRKKDQPTTEAICLEMKTTKRGECFFRLAEVSQKIAHCAQAIPFQEDCKLHLLTKKLITSKVTTIRETKTILDQMSLSFDSPHTKTVVYRHLLSKQHPIPIQNCITYPDAEECVMAAEGLYVDRLRYARDTNTFPCNDLGKLDHQSHPVLKKEYNRFQGEVCP
jgi:hypothetical protein